MKYLICLILGLCLAIPIFADDDFEKISVLLRNLYNPDDDIRKTAVTELPVEEYRSLIETAAQSDPDDDVREAATYRLSYIMSANTAIMLAYLAQNDPDDDVRYAAMENMDPKDIETFLKIWVNDQVAVNKAKAMGKIGSLRDTKSLQMLEDLFNKTTDPEKQKIILNVIYNNRGNDSDRDENTTSDLDKFLIKIARGNLGVDIRSQALRALKQGIYQEEILSLITQETDRELRIEALNDLSFEANKEFIKSLALFDKDPKIIETARTIIANNNADD